MNSFFSIDRDSGIDRQAIRQTEDRLIQLMRVVLGLSAQLVIFAHPEESIHGSTLITSLVLGLYVLYAIWAFVRTRDEDPIAITLYSWAHWIDVGWCLCLVAISRGAASSYFIGLLFPIVVSAFRWGFVSALRVTFVSVLGFIAVGAAHKTGFNASLVLIRSTWLLGLGYALAYCGEWEIKIRRRLGLISSLTGYANPRFGVDRTVAFILERLNDFYKAQFSLMVLTDPDGKARMLRTGATQAEAPAHFESLASELAQRLLELSPERAAIHNARREGWWRWGRSHQILDTTLGWAKKGEPLDSLAGIFDAKSFVTVPVHYRSQGIGRLYVVANKPVFVPSDMRFLLRVLDHVNPIMENIRLVEQLASYAADEERRKIARDIHDSVIQPYIGLQMGLAAILEETRENFPQISNKIDKLMEVTTAGINDLRSYVTGLKEEKSDGGLLPAMRRFAATFSEATGIAVDIETEGDLHANERLAAEAFQMMAEGLSNIRKHTHAARAKIRVICRLGHLILEITNEGSKGTAATFFTPESITQRAAALGGKVQIRALPNGGSNVIVDVPL